MKLGCSSWSYDAAIRHGRLDQAGWLRVCAEELELDGVELLDLHFPTTVTSYLREIRRTCTELQLTISCVSVSNDFGVADAEARREETAKVQAWVDIASFLGAPVLRVFAGWVRGGERTRATGGGLLAGVQRLFGQPVDPKRRRWSDAMEALRVCADYAQERGVVLGLENHNGGGLVGSAEQVERCLHDVGSPWIRLNLDTGDYGDLESVRRTLPKAVHVHAKLYDLDEDGADRRQDWPQIMDILARGRYRGYLSIEYEGEEDPVTAVPRGVRYLRRLLREADSL